MTVCSLIYRHTDAVLQIQIINNAESLLQDRTLIETFCTCLCHFTNACKHLKFIVTSMEYITQLHTDQLVYTQLESASMTLDRLPESEAKAYTRSLLSRDDYELASRSLEIEQCGGIPATLKQLVGTK